MEDVNAPSAFARRRRDRHSLTNSHSHVEKLAIQADLWDVVLDFAVKLYVDAASAFTRRIRGGKRASVQTALLLKRTLLSDSTPTFIPRCCPTYIRPVTSTTTTIDDIPHGQEIEHLHQYDINNACANLPKPTPARGLIQHRRYHQSFPSRGDKTAEPPVN